MSRRRFGAVGLVVATLVAATGCGAGATTDNEDQAYPAAGRKVRFIIGSEAGTTSDVTNRLLLKYVEEKSDFEFQVVNMPGAATQIGSQAVADAEPDGYTIGVSTIPSILGIYLDPETGAKFDRSSFTPIASIMFDPGATGVPVDSPYQNIGDLIDVAKQHPDTIKVGAGGHASRQELDWLDLETRSGAEFRKVTAGSDSDPLALLLGGSLDVTQESLGDFTSLLQGGKVRILGLWDDQRSEDYPDIPTMQEQGYDIVSGNARGIFGPAGLPASAVDSLEKAFKAAYDDTDFQAEMAKLGVGLRWMDHNKAAEFWQTSEDRVRGLLAKVNG